MFTFNSSVLTDTNLATRAVFCACVMISFFLFPWWWTFGWALVGAVLFGYITEVLLLALAYDAVFSPDMYRLTLLTGLLLLLWWFAEYCYECTT